VLSELAGDGVLHGRIAAEDGVDDGDPVDGQLGRLAHPAVPEHRVAVMPAERQLEIVRRLLHHRLHAGNRREQAGRVRVLEGRHVDAAIAQRRQPRRVVGHHAYRHPVQGRLARLPVVRVALQRPRLVLAVAHDAVRARTEQGLGGVERARLELLHRQDGAGGHRQDGQQRGVGAGEVDAHGVRVDGHHGGDAPDLLAPGEVPARIGQALEAAHHVGRGQGAAVGERGVPAQVEDIGRRRDLLPALGELGRDPQPVVGAHQLVVHQVEERPRGGIA